MNKNPLDELITHGHGPLDQRAKQQQDKHIKRVLLWFERGSPTTGQYLSSDLKKYLKQFPRLSITEGVLHRSSITTLETNLLNNIASRRTYRRKYSTEFITVFGVGTKESH